MYFDRKFTKAALKCMVLFGLALKAYFEHPTCRGKRKRSKCKSGWNLQCSLLPLCLSLRPATCCPVAFPFGRRRVAPLPFPSAGDLRFRAQGMWVARIPRVSLVSLALPWARFLLPLWGVHVQRRLFRP